MSSLFAFVKKSSVCQRQFKGTFGVSQQDFATLLSEFEVIWQQKKDAACELRWKNKKRKQKEGSGKKPGLATASNALCFVLYYLKQYPTFDALGALFNMTRGSANHLFHYHRKTLMESLENLGVLPPDKFKTVEEFQTFAKANGIEKILIDGTERVIQRPKNEARQKACYSGKKKSIR